MGVIITGQATKVNLGLANVDNVSDANKPVSNATQIALNAKASTTFVNTKLAEADTNNLLYNLIFGQ